MKTISPQEADSLIAQGALLVDIRSADEFAREHIAVALCMSPDEVCNSRFGQPVIFHCRSGLRTKMHADALAASAQSGAYVLAGGIDAWKQAGLPVVRVAGRPLPLQRQVQIAAGSLVVAGFVLGRWLHPGFFWLSGLVGAGLVFAGVSGFCGMARVLAKMPWNQRVL